MAGFRRTLDGLGFTEISTPKIVASATESGANVFRLDYFGRPAFLAQSPQFYKQALVGVFERVYETGKVWRAEPHETGRHLAEYTSLDAELGFIGDHFDVMAVVREAVAGMVESVRQRVPDAADLPEVPGRDPMAALRGHRRRRRRPRAGGRAAALRGARRVAVRDRLPAGEAAVLHPS